MAPGGGGAPTGSQGGVSPFDIEQAPAHTRGASPATTKEEMSKNCQARDVLTSWQVRLATVLLFLGVLLAIAAAVIGTKARSFMDREIRKQLVIDSEKSSGYRAWLKSSTASKTQKFLSYSLFNITNPDDVINGKPPVLKEVGPFSFVEETGKANVSFSGDGSLVSYATQMQHTYQGKDSDLDQTINMFNMPYAAAVNTVGGESNVLKAGSRQALTEVRDQLDDYFVPTLRENAVVTALQKSFEAADNINAMLGTGSVARMWGGGCVTWLFVRYCGFETFATLMKVFGITAVSMDANLMQMCLNTQIPKDQAIGESTVRKMWNAKDPLSLLNIDRYNASVRYGIAHWLWGNQSIQTVIQDHFDITEEQFGYVRKHLLGLYKSPELERRTLKQFEASAGKQDSMDVNSWDDFVMRQFLVGDVIGRLKADEGKKPVFESVQPDNPPEFSWYLKSKNVDTFKPNGVRWTTEQGECLFKLGNLPMPVFQTQVLDMAPPAHNRSEFVDVSSNGSVTAKASVDLDQCFPTDKDKEYMRGYLAYLGKNFVAERFEKDVINGNGGLITTRPVRELLLGHVSPILKLSLAKDDPRARLFNLIPNDPNLEGPAYCLSAADVDNPYSACVYAGDNVTEVDGDRKTMRLFSKVPHTYHTGSDDNSKLGAFYAYHGSTDIDGYWPNGSFPLAGGAQSLPGSVQYGYSTGEQFPAFNAISKDGVALYVFVPQFILPLKFVYQRDIKVKGVNLKRFVLSDENFSSKRPDAATFGMAKVKQEGLLNITGVLNTPAFFSKPNFPLKGEFSQEEIKGLKTFVSDRDDSYLDVEPITGKAMSARIQLQLNLATDNGAFGDFYKDLFAGSAIPVLSSSQSAEVSDDDAKFFKQQIYGNQKKINTATWLLAVLAAIFLLLGILLLVIQLLFGDRLGQWGREKIKGRTGSHHMRDEEAKAEGLVAV